MVKHGVHRTLWNERVWRSVRPLRARGLAVLTYHRVGCQRPFSPGIPVDVFRKQIRWISRNCKVVSPEDVPTTCFADRGPRRPSVLVTFDGGYRDYYTTAYPILREFNVRAVNFLATRFLDGSSHFWWDRVDAAVALSRVTGVRLPWNGRHIPMAGDGFEAAFTTQPAFNSLGVDPLLLGRFHAPMSAEKLAWMLSGWSKIL